MGVLDTVNARWVGSTMRLASASVDPPWRMRREMMSQSFIMKMSELWTAFCKGQG
jgi:DNA polymerase V